MNRRARPVRWTLLPALGLAAIGAWAGHRFLGANAALAWWLAVNAVTYPVWALDKSRARKGGRRVPEWTLHLLSLFGGGCAAVVAMQSLRHKTLKPVFRILHPLLAVLGVGALGWALWG
ncbi:MAG: DUF1294 domain-containing protein [Planctomycetota bacterium]